MSEFKKGMRGIIEEYANSELLEKEKGAWESNNYKQSQIDDLPCFGYNDTSNFIANVR